MLPFSWSCSAQFWSQVKTGLQSRMLLLLAIFDGNSVGEGAFRSKALTRVCQLDLMGAFGTYWCTLSSGSVMLDAIAGHLCHGFRGKSAQVIITQACGHKFHMVPGCTS